tara:strand:+ start:100 stop:240 length:141 start_codon:yes stop_codon:yes gene_type:complete
MNSGLLHQDKEGCAIPPMGFIVGVSAKATYGFFRGAIVERQAAKIG